MTAASDVCFVAGGGWVHLDGAHTPVSNTGSESQPLVNSSAGGHFSNLSYPRVPAHFTATARSTVSRSEVAERAILRVPSGISPRRAAAPAAPPPPPPLSPAMKPRADGSAGGDPAGPVARRALWLARLWDWIFVLVVLVGGTIALETLFEPRLREVNIETDASVQFSILPELVPSYALGILVILASIAAFCVFEFPLLRNASCLTLFLAYYLGFMESGGFTLFFTNIFKLIVGRPRPFFKAVCVRIKPGTRECIGDNSPGILRKIADARKSFPSGHSSLSFACFVYLTLYMAHKIRITDPRTPCRTIKLAALSLPLFTAGLVAVSRIVDHHHFYADVLAGSVLGTFIAIAVWSVRRRDIDMTRAGILAREEVLPMNNTFPASSMIGEDGA